MVSCQVEESLCEKSFVYNSFRQKGSILPLQINVVKRGSFGELKHFMMENSDTSANQFKVPRVIKKPEVVSFLQDKVIPQK